MDFDDKVILIGKIKNFLAEFNFAGATSIRFYNTLVMAAKEGNASKYIINYFKLTDNPFVEDLIPKLESQEFKSIVSELKKVKLTTSINKRLKIFFGAQGTGKTTSAISNTPGAKIMNCNSSLEPADLLESFDFENTLVALEEFGYSKDKLESLLSRTPDIQKADVLQVITSASGIAQYKKTPLFEAMENGEKVILEEMNLLTNDCLRSIQPYLDNKDAFDYKGRKVKIKDGFEIIATMNLDVNGERFALPEPLVDRAYALIEFEPSNEFIARLAFGDEDII